MGKSAGKDEAFDGAKFAAEILRRLPATQRERLSDAIEARDPEAFVKIEERMEALTKAPAPLPTKATPAVLRQDKVPMVQPAANISSKAPLENSTIDILTRSSQPVADDLESLPVNRSVETETAQRRARDEISSEQPVRKNFKKPGRYA